SGDAVDVSIEVRWACYYRLMPTLEQQRSYQGLEGTPNGSSGGSGSPSQHRQRGGLFPRFRRLACSASGRLELRRASTEGWTANCSSLQSAIEAELDRARSVVCADGDRLRWSTADEGEVAESDLASRSSYDAFVKRLP